MNGDVGETELDDRLGQPAGSTGKGLDQVQLEVGPGYGQRDAGQTGPGADVDDALRAIESRHQQVYDRAVQHVTVPEPWRLARPDESPADTGIGKDANEPLGQREPVAEDTLGGRRSPGHGRRFSHESLHPPPKALSRSCFT